MSETTESTLAVQDTPRVMGPERGPERTVGQEKKEKEGAPRKATRERDDSIDIMRAVGLLLIILAHTIPTKWPLFQVRNFDVPMMAVVSGMAFCVSAPDRIKLGSYYWKRVLRLLLPTYVFLTLFFLITAACFHFAGKPFPFKGQLLGTFVLRNVHSIGYVWIIRVFLLIALTAPLLHSLIKRIHLADFAFSLIAVYILYEIAFYNAPRPAGGWFRIFVDDYIFFAVSYTILFGVGMMLFRLGVVPRLAMALMFGVFFVLCVFLLNKGDTLALRTQAYKYPPRTYFVAWGLFMSTVLSMVFMKVRLAGFVGSLIRFLSVASLWIYLWHIAVLQVVKWNPETFTPFANQGWAQFAAVAIAATIITYFHRLLFGKLAGRLSGSPGIRKFVNEAFLK